MKSVSIIAEFLAAFVIHFVGGNVYFLTLAAPYQSLFVPLAFAGAVFCILMAFGFDSGVSINPLVSCNNYLNRRSSMRTAMSELLAQVTANLLAQYCLCSIYESRINVNYRYDFVTVLLFEVIASFALLLTITHGRRCGYRKLRYSVCIAVMVAGNGVLIGPISGAMTNPSLTLSLLAFCDVVHSGYLLFISCPFVALSLFRCAIKGHSPAGSSY